MAIAHPHDGRGAAGVTWVMPVTLELRQVHKSFGPAGGPQRVVLSGADLSVAAGRVVAIVGRSGSGKSTLLHLAAGIDRPQQGHILVNGQDLAGLDDSARTRLRRDQIGLVFQFFHLLSTLSVADNVALPELIAGTPARRYDARVSGLLRRVGLGDRAGDPAQKLSGGEMQRVAICRALIRGPALVLADEPTGNLDDANGQQVMSLMLEMTREEGRSLVYATHSREIAGLADEIRVLHNGQLEPA